MSDNYIERRILIGMVVSKKYLERIESFWDVTLLESPEARKLATWCMNYYQKYNQAPDKDIEPIYFEHLNNNKIPKDEAEFIDRILRSLSDEYGRDEHFNVGYLFDQTVNYLRSRKLQIHNEDVEALRKEGRVEEAEKLTQSYVPTLVDEISLGLELSSREALERIERAFQDSSGDKVLSYPGKIGEMWNQHFIRGGLISLLAPEKRGKSFWLLEYGMRAIRQKMNVAFFQAGDMTEDQQLRRIGIYLAGSSNEEKYCSEYYRGVGDCIFNQLDLCDREDRNCDHGIFDGIPKDNFLQNQKDFINYDNLLKKMDEFPDYEPCDSAICNERKGSVWLQKQKKKQKLTPQRAKKELAKFFRKYKRRFKLVTYPSDSLTVNEIRTCLTKLEKHDDFVPDIILIDYADLLTSNVKEYRHRVDDIWKNLRALSQEKHCLVITATQADSDSYKKDHLSLQNFSEDKRKYAHVTAMYGLNQDPKGREKKLGIMRINELVVREGEFSQENQVKVIQDIRIARSFLESYK